MIDVHASFQFSDVQVQADKVSAKWIVPHDLPYLQGHFPGQPIVPAVAMLDGTNLLLGKAVGRDSEILAVKNAKFTKPLEPGQSVQIEGKSVGPGEWSIDWKVGDETVAKLHLAI